VLVANCGSWCSPLPSAGGNFAELHCPTCRLFAACWNLLPTVVLLSNRSHTSLISHSLLLLLQVGSDMAAGEVVLRAGHHIDAAEVGILATVGATTVQ